MYSMCVYVHVCMWLYVIVHVILCHCTSVYVCMCTSVCVCMCAYECICMYVCTCVCVWHIWIDVKPLLLSVRFSLLLQGGSESHSIHCPTKTVVWDCDIGTDHPDVPAFILSVNGIRLSQEPARRSTLTCCRVAAIWTGFLWGLLDRGSLGWLHEHFRVVRIFH